MEYDTNNVPDDLATLQALVISLSQSNVKLQDTVNKLTEELRRLTTLLEKLFGNSSEKLPKDKPTESPTMELYVVVQVLRKYMSNTVVQTQWC